MKNIPHKRPTPLGEITITPTEAKHLHVGSDSIVVRNILHRISGHLYLWADGSWHVGEERQPDYERSRQMYVSRRDTSHRDTYNDASTAAHTKICEVVTAVVNEWAIATSWALKAAQKEYVAKEVQNRHDQIANHQKAIETLQAEIVQLNNGENLTTKTNTYYFTGNVN
jgi:hypothetical protein